MKPEKITGENAAAIAASASVAIRKTASASLKQKPVSAVTIVPSKVNVAAKTPKPKSSKSMPLPYPADASKQDRMLALLTRSTGATIDELMNTTDWQAHSIRGFLSATVRKKLQLPLITEMRATGERIYRIAGVGQ